VRFDIRDIELEMPALAQRLVLYSTPRDINEQTDAILLPIMQ